MGDSERGSIRRIIPGALAVLIILALSGCAVAEFTSVEPTPTAGPSFVIPPPPTQVFTGECSLDDRSQEFWIQTAAGQAQSFRTLFAQALDDTETRQETMGEMWRLRDETYQNPTPECAVPIQLLLTSAMGRSLESLRLTILDPAIDISGTAALVNEMLTQVEDQLKLMMDDMERRLQTREAEGS